MTTKDSIETAYSFLHQKQRIYVLASLRWQASKARAHSTLDWQKDDIELAISDYADDMSQVIGLPLRSSKNCMKPSVVAGLTSYATTSGFRRTSPRLSIYLYDVGVLVWLWAILPLLIFLVEVVLLTVQVHSEEKRLEKDFGKDYLDYKKRVGRYFTI